MKKPGMLLPDVHEYVADLLRNSLSPALTFHNLDHTFEVLAAVKIIGKNTGLSAQEMENVQVAALFHDTGYIYTYRDHEDESIRLALDYLRQHQYDEEDIRAVTGCIAATKIPQRPGTVPEQVICDADLYHFSQPGYVERAQKLRQEWEYYLDRQFTQSEWNDLNYAAMCKHNYFTAYGKSVLQTGKRANITKLLSGSP